MDRGIAPRRPLAALASAIGLLALALALATSAGHAQADPAAEAGVTWTQVFDDEFSGTALDRGSWYPNRWFAATCAKGATSEELEYYTGRQANVSVADGHLQLTARKESYSCGEGSWAGTSSYTSGWVQTGGARASDGSAEAPGFTLGLGYVEARIKLPAGKGLWPAVWMLQTYRDGGGKQQ